MSELLPVEYWNYSWIVTTEAKREILDSLFPESIQEVISTMKLSWALTDIEYIIIYVL